MGLSTLKCEVTSNRLAKLMTYFLRLIFSVPVNNREFWQFRFHGVHFNHNSQNSFSVHHDSKTPCKNDRARRDENKLAPSRGVARIFQRGGSQRQSSQVDLLGKSEILSRRRRHPTRGVWGHAPPGNFKKWK